MNAPTNTEGSPDRPRDATVPVAAIRTALPSLRPAERRVAQAILDDPAWASAASIEAVAERVEVGASTVSRLVRALGFANFRQFRLALAGAPPEPTASEDAPASAIDPDDTLAEIAAKIGHSDARAIQETVAALDLDQLEAAVATLAGAGRIAISGIGAGALVAGDLHQKLHRIGLPATLATDSHAAATAAALLTAGDVAVVVSHSGETRDLLVTARLARERGATTIALTDAADSGLALAADVRLVTVARETTFRAGAMSSRIAQLVVVDVLFVAVAARTFESAGEALRLTREAVETLRRAR